MAYFYFDFRNVGKQGLQDLLRSLLIQLSAHPVAPCNILCAYPASRCDILCDYPASRCGRVSAHPASRCDILSDLYSAHDNGRDQPGDRDLKECLKQMLVLPYQLPTYLIIDALDESPNSPGIPSSREKVLQIVEEFVKHFIPNLHIFVTSRPEIDIRNVLEHLTPRQVSLHDQRGQKEDIADYVRSVVYSNSEQIMRRWRTEDKELVIKLLSERADGM